MKNLICHIPIPIAGVALGLTALGNLIQSYSEGLRMVCGAVAAGIILLLFTRMIFFFQEVKKEFDNPIIAGVSATIFMTCMQLATYAQPYMGIGADVLWFAAVLGHGVLIIWFTVKFVIHFQLEIFYPTCFITYVGIVVASVTSGAFGREGLGEMIFWFGFIAYAAMFVMISIRCWKEPLPESARPLLCIYTAPMSLSLTGYLASVGNPSVPFVILLEILAQILYVMVLIQLPKLLKLPFYPSYAAFTFPFVITAFGLKRMIFWMEGNAYTVPEVLQVVLLVETWIAMGMVLYALLRYGYYLLGFVRWNKRDVAKQVS